MLPDVNTVTRALPIDGPVLDDVVARLRRDSPGPALRWTLGTRGVAEVDTGFVRHEAGWTTRVRLWDASGPTATGATLTVAVAGTDGVRITLEPVPLPAPAWDRDGSGLEQLEQLARAAVDEIGEELLWHASRSRLARRAP